MKPSTILFSLTLTFVGLFLAFRAVVSVLEDRPYMGVIPAILGAVFIGCGIASLLPENKEVD